jgi:hypothetical protein
MCEGCVQLHDSFSDGQSERQCVAGQQVYEHCDLNCAQICTLDLHMHSHGIDKTWPSVV